MGLECRYDLEVLLSSCCTVAEISEITKVLFSTLEGDRPILIVGRDNRLRVCILMAALVRSLHDGLLENKMRECFYVYFDRYGLRKIYDG